MMSHKGSPAMCTVALSFMSPHVCPPAFEGIASMSISLPSQNMQGCDSSNGTFSVVGGSVDSIFAVVGEGVGSLLSSDGKEISVASSSSLLLQRCGVLKGIKGLLSHTP
jgi:hypothetical protein